MYKVTVVRELITRDCTRYFDFVREFDRYIDALEYAVIVEERFGRFAQTMKSDWFGDSCVIELNPHYHRVTVSVSEVG